MSKSLKKKSLNDIYKRYIVDGKFNESVDYYKIYKKRYFKILNIYESLFPNHNTDILDIGGGQFAIMCNKLFGCLTIVFDIDESNFEFLNSHGIETVKVDITKDVLPDSKKFDVIFFSEVVGHLSVPPYIVLKKFYNILKPNGVVICTTPNLFRIRNIIYLILGKSPFGYFTYSDKAIGRLTEYSKEHLVWQFEQAGFIIERAEVKQFYLKKTGFINNLISFITMPLLLIPHFRDNLLIVARKQ